MVGPHPDLSPVAWVLNLDAEDELSHPGSHTPTRAMTERIVSLIPTLRRSLIGPHDQILWPLGEVSELPVRCWMPTRFARSLTSQPIEAPPMEILRTVNHRAFSSSLGQHLPGATFATTLDAVHGALTGDTTWLLKRPWGYAGRGRKKMTRATFDQPWVQAGLREGGVQIEPLVDRLADFGQHGMLERDGHFSLGTPTIQHIDIHGAWQSSEPTIDFPEAPVLRETGVRVAAALHAAGYFGPFGIDAFRWRDADGQTHFQPLSEINARYSMGFHR